MDEPADVRVMRGQRLGEVAREDLDLYSIGELEERIAVLQGEIDRAAAQIEKKRSVLAAADALFGRGTD